MKRLGKKLQQVERSVEAYCNNGCSTCDTYCLCHLPRGGSAGYYSVYMGDRSVPSN